MFSETNLRWLRNRYHISLRAIAEVSDLSKQYVSNSELGNISPSPRLERQLASALERIISDRREELLLLEADFLTYRGRLLEAAEDRPDEH